MDHHYVWHLWASTLLNQNHDGTYMAASMMSVGFTVAWILLRFIPPLRVATGPSVLTRVEGFANADRLRKHFLVSAG